MQIFSIISQILHDSEGHMTVYGPGSQPL